MLPGLPATLPADPLPTSLKHRDSDRALRSRVPDCILARHKMNAVDLEHHNPNLIGGYAWRSSILATCSSDPSLAQIPTDAAARCLSMFRLDPAGGRRPRHVRLSRAARWALQEVFGQERRKGAGGIQPNFARLVPRINRLTGCSSRCIIVFLAPLKNRLSCD